VAIIYVAVEGMLDDVPLDKIGEFEQELIERLTVSHDDVLDEIRETEKLSDDAKATIEEVANDLVSIYRETEGDEEAAAA